MLPERARLQVLECFDIINMRFIENGYIICFFLDENEEESDEPPVPVVKEIKEKDAFYSKK